MPLERIFCGRTVALIATGPSLTPQQVDAARRKGFALAGCNNVWEMVPDLELLYACNEGWWNYYWSEALARHPAQKWTTNAQAAQKYGLNWIAERNRPGLSKDPTVIHHGHGSGYSLLNLAYLMGAARIVLLGYDLRYAPNYSGAMKQVGSSPRHYFAEYPEPLRHWPKQQVVNGVHVGLLELYRGVAKQNAVEIINCTPGSALDCFARSDIESL